MYIHWKTLNGSHECSIEPFLEIESFLLKLLGTWKSILILNLASPDGSKASTSVSSSACSTECDLAYLTKTFWLRTGQLTWLRSTASPRPTWVPRTGWLWSPLNSRTWSFPWTASSTSRYGYVSQRSFYIKGTYPKKRLNILSKFSLSVSVCLSLSLKNTLTHFFFLILEFLTMLANLLEEF